MFGAAIAIALTALAAPRVAAAQTIATSLSGKRIYLHGNSYGHAIGFQAVVDLLQSRKAVYGYGFEYTAGPTTESRLDSLVQRLYDPARPRTANTIDILIICQGEGDANIGGNWSTTPLPGAAERFARVNAHVRNGGGLVFVHAAGGREVTWQGWDYCAKLMTDWFADDYILSPTLSNGGEGGIIDGIYALDPETLPERDPSAYFIRKILGATGSGGYGQPLATDSVLNGYLFNGGFKYEDGMGGKITSANTRIARRPVRGDPGIPGEGIGPAKIFSVFTHINFGPDGYTPPKGGRISVWGREVGKGYFDKSASAENGRFVMFSPGHRGNDFTRGNGWLGDYFMANLRWLAKEDRGCTNSAAINFAPTATVDDGTCTVVGLGNETRPHVGKSASVGLKKGSYPERLKVDGRVFRKPAARKP